MGRKGEGDGTRDARRTELNYERPIILRLKLITRSAEDKSMRWRGRGDEATPWRRKRPPRLSFPNYRGAFSPTGDPFHPAGNYSVVVLIILRDDSDLTSVSSTLSPPPPPPGPHDPRSNAFATFRNRLRTETWSMSRYISGKWETL